MKFLLKNVAMLRKCIVNIIQFHIKYMNIRILNVVKNISITFKKRGAQWLSGRVLKIEGLRVRPSLEGMRCVFEQDTLSSAPYLFNPG